MAFQRPWRWILPVLLGTTHVMAEITPTQEANMESDDCDRLAAYTITDSDILQVYALVPQRPGGTATRDHCVIEVRTSANRRLRIYVMDYVFNDCGNRVEIYDGSSHQVTPNYIVGCDSKLPDKYDTRKESVRIRLSKQSAAALSYRFNLVVTTDQGPDIDFEQSMSSYDQSVLSIGVIVGLAIAGGLLFIAILAIAIYCVVKQRKKNMDAEKAQPAESSVYTSGNSKVLFPSKKGRSTNNELSSNDSHNSSYSSADGQNTYVNMNPDPKGRQSRNKGYENKAYASSDDGGTHDRSRDSTGSDDISAGQVNGSFDSTSDAPSKRKFSKNQENGHGSGSLSRSARRGSARSKSSKRKDSANTDNTRGPSRDRSHRSRSSSGHRSGHRDSGRRSRSHGERGGSQRRSRSRSPHSQSSNQSHTGAFDSKGHNKMYDVSSMSKRSRESSNSSTSSRDSGDDRTVSYDPSGRRGRTRDRGHYNRAMENDEDQYGSQV